MPMMQPQQLASHQQLFFQELEILVVVDLWSFMMRIQMIPMLLIIVKRLLLPLLEICIQMKKENLIFSNQHLDITQLVFQEQFMVFGVFIKGLVLCHGQIYYSQQLFQLKEVLLCQIIWLKLSITMLKKCHIMMKLEISF